MELFTALIEALLGPERAATVALGDDGVPRLNLATGGAICLEPECLVLEAVDVDHAGVAAACDVGTRLRRVYDFASRFPAEFTSGTDRVVVTLAPANSGETLDSDGLRGVLRVMVFEGPEGEISSIMESECVVVTAEALNGAWEAWAALLSVYDERRATWAARLSEIYPEDVCLELPKEPVEPADDGWNDFLAALDVSPETAEDVVSPIVEAAFETLVAVRAKYEALYGLKLPSGLAPLAALVEALGTLPSNPPKCFWEPEPGRDRGCAWLDSALSMRPAGLLSWFAPGGLDRATLEASEAYREVPPGCDGPLDPRLDMRYRADAPQFVTFLGGDSDGLHWGFWYDSPEHFPVIAHNYARDSAETWLDGVAEVVPFLRRSISKATEEAFEELLAEAESSDDGKDGEISYPIARWRALRVVTMLLDAIESQSSAGQESEPTCPWPRTDGYPTGSPALALRPDAGTVPSDVVSYHGTADRPLIVTPPGWRPTGPDEARPSETHEAWIADARRELSAGRPAYAHALGLYLHWADADDVREAAGALLLDAYEAQGFRAFAEILRVHLRHRDLPSVGVFRGE